MPKSKALMTPAPEDWNPQQIELIKNTVAKGASDMELALFLQICKRAGLDPFTKQIHFIKRRTWNKDTQAFEEVGSIQTGIDGYRAIAARTGAYAGEDDAIFDSETEEHPIKATVTVYRLINGERVAFTATARWKEYAPLYIDKNGSEKLSGVWNKMPYAQLAKCAASLALRKGFPNDLSGIYTTEEMTAATEEASVRTIKHIQHEDVYGESVDVESEPVEATILRTPPLEPASRDIKELKNQIKSHLTVLGRSAKTQKEVADAVMDMTKLPLTDANYEEIETRLAIIASETF